VEVLTKSAFAFNEDLHSAKPVYQRQQDKKEDVNSG